MTAEEQSLADQKMRVEIARLMAETAEINQKFAYSDRKSEAEIKHMESLTGKLARETYWYPVFVAAALLGAGAAVGATVARLVS
ncbi:MAG: hypothetical protein AAF903_08045 [Pseudomonadota bacterium]